MIPRKLFTLKAQETWPASLEREYDPGEGIAVQLFTSGGRPRRPRRQSCGTQICSAISSARSSSLRRKRTTPVLVCGAALSHSWNLRSALVVLCQSPDRHAARFRAGSLAGSGRKGTRHQRLCRAGRCWRGSSTIWKNGIKANLSGLRSVGRMAAARCRLKSSRRR